MSDRRIEIEDLGGLSELPPDDPRRKALDGQPSARAQLRAYQEFMAPGDSPRVEELTEAEERLAAALEREIGVPIGTGTGPRQARRSAVGSGFWGWFMASPLRPALAAAAVVVGVAAVVLIRPVIESGREPQMRGSATPAAGAWDAHLSASAGAQGTTLTWSPAPGAESYTVVFLSSDLQEMARVSDLPGTELALARGALPPGLVSGQSGLWRVLAYHGGDEVARSATAPIQAP